MNGTHLGEFFGVPPTGKSISVQGIYLEELLKMKYCKSANV